MSFHDLPATPAQSGQPVSDQMLPELVGVDADGNVHLVQRDEAGDVVRSQNWSPGTDVADTVHAMIEWLSSGAPGSFASFEI